MGLTTSDVNAVRAQWEEWTADAGFELSIEVKDDPQPLAMDVSALDLGARATSQLYVQVQIRRGEVVVFDERVPYDARMLRASVSVLAKTIAGAVALAEGG